MKKSKEFENKMHFVGRLSLLICILGVILVPFGFSIYYGLEIALSTIFQVVVPPFITYTITVSIGCIATAPLVGAGAQYVASVTGNVNNVKIPACINGMEICDVEPGTEKGDTVSLLAVCVCSVVAVAIMILGMVFLAPIFQPIYENAFFSPGFSVVTPALYGAMLTPFFLKNVKESAVPFVLPIILIFVIGRKTWSDISSYMMLVMMVAAVIWVYILHSVDFKKSREEEKTEHKGE